MISNRVKKRMFSYPHNQLCLYNEITLDLLLGDYFSYVC